MPVLVIVDAQKEYVTQGRPFYLEAIGPSLENLQKLLAHARAHGWKIAHMRHQQNSMCFTYGSPFAEFIDGFGPAEGEESMVKPNFSCFRAASSRPWWTNTATRKSSSRVTARACAASRP